MSKENEPHLGLAFGKGNEDTDLLRTHGVFQVLRPSHYMGLSLFIILLGFFIALTSMSDIQANKSESVIQSVNNAFSSADFLADLNPHDTPNEKEGLNRGQGVLPEEQIKNLFGKTLGDLGTQNLDIRENDGDGVMQMSIGAAVFDNYAPQFAAKLSEILQNEDLSTDFEVELMLPFPADTDFSDAGRYTSIFAQAGFPMNRIVIGFDRLLESESKKDYVQLRFVYMVDYTPTQSGERTMRGGQ